MNRCIGKTCDDGPAENGEARPRWAKTGLLCTRCAGKLEQRLAELPAKQDQLRSVLGGLKSKGGSGNRPTKGEPPVPLNIAAHDHLELLHATVVSWTQLVAEERSLRGPDRSEVEVLSRWLLSQHSWLVEQLWVDDLAEEMRELAQVADSLAAINVRWNRLPVPCPDCNAHELGRWDGASEVQCGACDLSWHEDDYPRMLKVLTWEKSVTAAEAAEKAGVEPATFRQWVSRGKVKRVGTVDGQARYSAEDVERAQREDGAA